MQILAYGVTEALKEPAYRHADLGLFTEQEAHQLDDLVALVGQYLALNAPQRPLSVAIFGAPGSGKSRLAKALAKLLAARGTASGGTAAKLAELVSINLTQITSKDELGTAVAHAALTAGAAVPFVFIDEFDAGHDGAPWGWLSWFLAPMQDGEFRSSGTTVKMNRTVFVFAGGTASTFASFGHSNRAVFIAAKGPDFVSRLRGYVDIPGVNAEPHRDYRRAATLGYQLRERKITVADDLRDALLQVGRYKHGARSMVALIELIPPASHAHLAQIQQHGLTAMHVDRGPLDPHHLGGSIGLSAGVDDSKPELAKVWRTVSKALFREGAQLSYGGTVVSQHGLVEQLVEVVKDLPQPLVPGGGDWILTSPETEQPPIQGVKQIPRPPVRDGELPADLPEPELGRWRAGLQWFRMRHQLALRSVARFAVGGRLDAEVTQRSKRFPGVAEELMLALAMGQPIYVAGHCEGGAHWAGRLLGLDRRWLGRPTGVHIPSLLIPPEYAALFRPPPFTDLPLGTPELIAFFEHHALGGDRWPDNGLRDDENRELFETTSATRIAELVVKGLHRRFVTEGGGPR
jgi:energy-coupling factor transporter ATP-binding protein EcfA2